MNDIEREERRAASAGFDRVEVAIGRQLWSISPRSKIVWLREDALALILSPDGTVMCLSEAGADPVAAPVATVLHQWLATPVAVDTYEEFPSRSLTSFRGWLGMWRDEWNVASRLGSLPC